MARKLSANKVRSNATDVARHLDELNHPLRNVIDQLRKIIVGAVDELEENIKWNGPNYSHRGEDRITMRVHPPTQVMVRPPTAITNLTPGPSPARRGEKEAAPAAPAEKAKKPRKSTPRKKKADGDKKAEKPVKRTSRKAAGTG